MAFGEHWEWRGFGVLPDRLLRRLESLPLKFPDSQDLTDEYLWIPGRAINVKLRLRDLKFKRLLEKAGHFERWLEDAGENYAFPLHEEVLLQLMQILRVALGSLPPHPVERDELLGLLARASPPVRVVAVTKSRWQHEWSPGEAGRAWASAAVTVEVARIEVPEITTSVGIEHPELEGVRAAHEALGVGEFLRSLSYVEAVAIWGQGKTIGRAARRTEA